VWAPNSGNNLTAFDSLLPNLALLRNHSIVYSNYTVAATQCTPSRATLLTGLYAQQTCMFQTQGSNNAPSLIPANNVTSPLAGFPTIGSVATQSFLNFGTYWYGKWHLSDFYPNAEGVGQNGPIDYGFTDWSGSVASNLPSGASEAAPNGLANEGTQGVNPNGGPAPPQNFSGNPLPPQFKPLKWPQTPEGTVVSEFNDAYIADRFVQDFLPNVVANQSQSYWFAALSFVNPHDATFFPYGFGLSDHAGNLGFPYGAISYNGTGWQDNNSYSTPGYSTPLTLGYNNTSASNSWDYYVPALNTSLYTTNPNSDWNFYDYPALGNYNSGYGKPDGQNLYLQYLSNSTGSVGGYNASNQTASNSSNWLLFLNYYFWLQSCVDYQIGRVLSSFAINQPTSDHVEYGGSHWLHGKGSSAYEESIHVPLYISYPSQRGDWENFNNTSLSNSVISPYICSSVDILPFILSFMLGNESWRNNSSDPVNYLSGRESIFDSIYLNNYTQRRVVDVDGSPMTYVLHTCDDFSPPSNNTYARHVIGMRLIDAGQNRTKFVQYSPWENIPVNNNNPPTSTGNMVVSYTQPFGNNLTNSQFELYLPTNPNELKNDYGPNQTAGNNFMNAMYSVLNEEIYKVPAGLTDVYNQAFANYWAYQGLSNGDDDSDLTGIDIGPLL
jgi:arylsulfatase A-like enzyme